MNAQTPWYMLELALCGMQQRCPDRALLQTMDWEAVYQACQRQSIAALCGAAIETALSAPDPWQLTEAQQTVWRNWRQERFKSLRKSTLMEVERGALEAFLEQQGIWYLPLKGIVLQHLYPTPGTRQMADNDILFDAAYRETVRDWFCANGYTTEMYEMGNHDVYQKPPVFNFEMHIHLFSASTHNAKWVAYYDAVYSRLHAVEGHRYQMQLTPEDFYVYCTVHAAKHHDSSGTGLRTLLDEMMYLRHYEATMDWDYIEQQLQQLDVAAWEHVLRSAAQQLAAWQGQSRVGAFVAALPQQTQELLAQMVDAGTYGTLQNRIEHKLRALQPSDAAPTLVTKLRYIGRRLVPDVAFFRAYHPFFNRHPWLIPFGMLYRMGKGLVCKAPVVWRELKCLWQTR